MYILGIWDGHDSGAAIIKDNRILFAVGEERLTRRKLEIRFPELSIKAALNYHGLSAKDIQEISVSSYDPVRTASRVFPLFDEEYYLIRRRKKRATIFTHLT